MTVLTRATLRALLFASASAVLAGGAVAHAQATGNPGAQQPAAIAPEAPSSGVDVVVQASHATRSAISLPAPEIQKILPGISPLKAIQTLPGVLYETADPWGNNEQNEALIVHGFTTQQLGYTMDGVPLGDQ